MEGVTRNHSRPSMVIVAERRRLNGRLIRWIIVGVSSVAGYTMLLNVWLPEWLFVLAGVMAIAGAAASIVGFVLDGYSRWELAEADPTERFEYSEFERDAPRTAVRLVRRRGNRIELSGWRFDDDEWDLIRARLERQNWRFNRDIFAGIVPDLTRRNVWPALRDEWIEQGYVRRDGRSLWVRDAIRRALDRPAPPRRQGQNWLVWDDSDEDDE